MRVAGYRGEGGIAGLRGSLVQRYREGVRKEKIECCSPREEILTSVAISVMRDDGIGYKFVRLILAFFLS